MVIIIDCGVKYSAYTNNNNIFAFTSKWICLIIRLKMNNWVKSQIMPTEKHSLSQDFEIVYQNEAE